MIAKAEAAHGIDSHWNSVWKLQEVIYRGRAPAKIRQLMAGVDDLIAVGKIKTAGLSCVCGCGVHWDGCFVSF